MTCIENLPNLNFYDGALADAIWHLQTYAYWIWNSVSCFGHGDCS